uniref:DNA-repair protein Xrcc1 N-terminal domain-containing protein n=1 Tax=Buteo japonicus TaxID=224669 RepID=A0A8B9YZP8_9AVES
MAPVKISYIVSFSSQDPKYPVENLLHEDSLRPWLSCPQDRSRQLKVELQLERASPIGYVDIGNCGCAFLQIEVGRSSWPLEQPYLTLVPSVALMTPADSKLDQNRCGVRMFKEADFLALAVGQKWDRLRLTCSQPFSKHSQFGLSFIRVRTPLDSEHPQPPPPSQPGATSRCCLQAPGCLEPRLPPTCLLAPPCGADGLSVSRSSREEEQLKSRLQQLEPTAWSPARLSRPAQMVLSAVRSRAAAGIFREGVEPKPHAHTNTREPGTTMSSPLSLGRFSLDLLPLHASRCGEEDPDAAWPSSSLAETSPDTWVSCPICELPFSVAEVEWHASTCGEQAGTLGTPSSSYRVR